MKTHKKLFLRLFWVAFMGLVSTLTTTTPSCKAQEVNPTRFTATGIEDEVPVQKPQTKKATAVKTSALATPKIPAWTVATFQKERSQSSLMRADNKRAPRRVSVKKSSEPPRE